MTQIRHLAAIMFTDIVGYTAIMGKDEVKAFSLLEQNRKIQLPLISKYQGRLLKEIGDGTMAQFNSAYDAVQCAVEIQRTVAAEMEGRLRIGIHLGDITEENDDVFGDGVNVASRIQSIADPGGIYISASVETAIRNRTDIKTKYVGEARLKNVDYPVKLFAVQGESLPAPAFRQQHNKNKRKPALYAALLVILVIAGWLIFKNTSKETLQTISSMVVLPVSNLTGSEENKYILDGLQDALITELSKIKSLRLISRTSANAYQNTQKSGKQIAEELNVDAFIESSVMKAGDSIKFNVQLIKVNPEEDHLWAGIFDQSIGKMLIMVSNVTKQISENIKAVLSPEEETLISNKTELDPELYKLYLKGKYFLDQYTPEGFEKGLTYLNEVIEKDPTYARAYAALSIGYGDLSHLPSAPHDAFPRAKAFAERALKLDPTLVEANTAMAETNLYNTWQFINAEKYFKAALAIDSSFVPAVSNYGWYLDLIGNHEGAEYYLRRGADLDPLAPIYRTWLGWYYWIQKRYDEGITEINKVLQYSPDFPVAKFVLGGIYAETGKFDEAIKLTGEAYAENPGLAYGLGIAYIKSGKIKEARELIDKLDKGPYNAFSMVRFYTELGDTEEIVKWTKVVYNIRHIFTPWLGSGFKTELRNEPRIKEIMKTINDSIASAQASYSK